MIIQTDTEYGNYVVFFKERRDDDTIDRVNGQVVKRTGHNDTCTNEMQYKLTGGRGFESQLIFIYQFSFFYISSLPKVGLDPRFHEAMTW